MSASTPSAAARPPGERPSAAAVLIALGVSLFILHQLSGLLTPIVLSAALAYAVHPLVLMLTRRLRWPPLVASIAVFCITTLVLAACGYWIVGTFARAAFDVGQNLPQVLGRIVHDTLGPTIDFMGATYETTRIPQAVTAEIMNSLQNPGWILVGGEAVVGVPASAVLMLVTLFYFIASGPQLAQGIVRLIAPRYRPHLVYLAEQVDPMLRRYVRGVFIVVLYTALVAFLVLSFVFHLPFAGMISVLVGGLELLPVVGPAVSMVLISASALLSGHGLSSVFWALGFAVLLRVSIDELLGPIVLGRFVDLHPVAVIVAFLVAGGLFGVPGVLLAVPACAAAKLILRIWHGEATPP